MYMNVYIHTQHIYIYIYTQVMAVRLFGHQLPEYREIGRSMITLIETTLSISGDDFERMLEVNVNTTIITMV